MRYCSQPAVFRTFCLLRPTLARPDSKQQGEGAHLRGWPTSPGFHRCGLTPSRTWRPAPTARGCYLPSNCYLQRFGVCGQGTIGCPAGRARHTPTGQASQNRHQGVLPVSGVGRLCRSNGGDRDQCTAVPAATTLPSSASGLFYTLLQTQYASRWGGA